MHICFPFEIEDFVGEAARYVELLAPELTIVNSTVAVGTTRAHPTSEPGRRSPTAPCAASTRGWWRS